MAALEMTFLNQNLLFRSTMYSLSPHRAHLLRVFVFISLILSFYDGAAIAPKVVPEFWIPVGPAGPLLNFLHKTWGGEAIVSLQYIIRSIGYLAALVSMVGYQPRIFAKVFAAAVFLSLSFFASARGIRHSDLPLIISSGVAAFIPWTDRSQRTKEDPVDLWPIHLQRFLFVYVFISAGVEKIINNGSNWIWGNAAWETLHWVQLGYAHRLPTEIQVSANHLLASLPPDISRLLGILIIMLEICAPPLLYFRRPQSTALALLVSLLVGFRLTLFVPFSGYYCLIVYWLPYFNPRKDGPL